ncbi:MAG TPA: GNAT family N-acetyltransferase [Paucimonas sp.]|nr:GNAT family N-acetyltransferase [Paucimonas sp.]
MIPTIYNGSPQDFFYRLNETPIKELPFHEIKFAVAQMRDNIDEWRKDLDGAAGTWTKGWTKRINDANAVLRAMERVTNEAIVTLGYFAQNSPIGLLILENVDTIDFAYIPLFVTHPGSETVGGALLEEAVKKSQDSGHCGRIFLRSGSPEAAKAYEKMGFERVDLEGEGDEMTLDPSKSELWHEVEGKWQLKKFEGQKFFG